MPSEWSWNPFSNVDKGLSWEGVGQFLTQGPWDIPGHVRDGLEDLFSDDDKKPTPPKPRPGDAPRDANKGTDGDDPHKPPPAKPGANGGRIDNSNSPNSKDDSFEQWFADNGPLVMGGVAAALLLLAFVFKALRG